MDQLEVDGAVIEYHVQGSGAAVLLIPVGIVADGLGRPLLAQPELASHHRLIHYHRRGYMGSTSVGEPPTIERQANDAAALLRHLEVGSAHVVGHSIGALITMQLAVQVPGVVHSLSLLEPPLPNLPNAGELYARVIAPMVAAYRAGDKQRALDSFADIVFGPNWRSIVEHTVPGGVERAVEDFDTFMREQPTIAEWHFGADEAAAIRQPVLSVLGARSTPMAQRSRELLHAWFPQLEELDLDTTHLLQMQDPQGMARGLAAFFGRHPLP